eukprot:6210659-Pleurochrysis_carterae.AAC.1
MSNSGLQVGLKMYFRAEISLNGSRLENEIWWRGAIVLWDTSYSAMIAERRSAHCCVSLRCNYEGQAKLRRKGGLKG